MLGTLWLPDPICLRLVSFEVDSNHMSITVATTPTEAMCPLCHHPSEEVHSRYERTLTDLPWGGTAMQLRLHLRVSFAAPPPVHAPFLPSGYPR